MATPTLINPPHKTEAICPPWCAGHDEDAFQPWEDEGTADAYRLHSTETPATDGVSVLLSQTEGADRALAAPVVMLTVDIPGSMTADLTPHQAMNLARRLLDAADAALDVMDSKR